MNEKTMEMRRYIDRSRALKGGYTPFTSKELLALGQFAQEDSMYSAILLGMNYGYAKGVNTQRRQRGE